MKHTGRFRLGGAVAAAGLLLAQLGALPTLAAEQTGKDISKCDYVMDASGMTVSRGMPQEFSLSLIGVPADKTPTQIWIDISVDVSAQLPVMPALGYNAPGCGEYDWYADGLWMDSPSSTAVIVFDIPEEYPVPDTFQIQLWGEEGESLDSIDLNAVGIYIDGTNSSGNHGSTTQKGAGDINSDSNVDKTDVVLLRDYLVKGEAASPFSSENADLNKNNLLNAADLTLLKRGIMDGSLNQGGPSTLPDGETAMEFVSHITMGWNLGNTLDAVPSAYSSPTQAETSWGCPMTTKAMIDFVKQQGFNLVRVPVSWGQKMDNNTYQIDDRWMERVQEVVDYVIDNDMYCILNIHHDNEIANRPYFYPDSAHYEQSEKFVTAVWEQVSAKFAGYDNHLIFETLNEPRLVGNNYEWWIQAGNAECVDAMNNINKLNAAALDTIRRSGGNNETRFVMMPTYAASPDTANLAGMEMPNDDHLIAEIHAYRPYSFALDMSGTSNWNEASDAAELSSFMNALKAKYLSKNIPVIIDEFGAMNKNNEDVRAAWVKYYLELADSYGMPCVWWDNNAFNTNGENFGLINRNSLTVEYPKIMAAMVEATKNRG